MKALLLSLALMVFPCFGQEHHHVVLANTGTSFKADKQFHFVIGYTLANVGWAIAKDMGWKHPHLYGIALALLAGLWKEHQD